MIIIPGVGSFKHAMNRFRNLGYDNTLKEYILNETNVAEFVWVCNFCFHQVKNLIYKRINFIEGEVKEFKKVKIFESPHVGWNNIIKMNHKFIPKKYLKEKYYFTHSLLCT